MLVSRRTALRAIVALTPVSLLAACSGRGPGFAAALAVRSASDASSRPVFRAQHDGEQHQDDERNDRGSQRRYGDRRCAKVNWTVEALRRRPGALAIDAHRERHGGRQRSGRQRCHRGQ